MVTGVKLAYDDAGSGDCVVLIHGHPFDRTLWQPQVAALRGDFRVWHLTCEASGTAR